jgi:lactate dehydrogenase-like 2-hydroxyacid dehydrogenase
LIVGIPPLKSSLRHVSKAVFEALPLGGVFVLVSRMAVADEAVLWAAINKRKLRAAINVFLIEPVPCDASYRFHPNVLTTRTLRGMRFTSTSAALSMPALAHLPLSRVVRSAVRYRRLTYPRTSA